MNPEMWVLTEQVRPASAPVGRITLSMASGAGCC
jgi:hypothetical protein